MQLMGLESYNSQCGREGKVPNVPSISEGNKSTIRTQCKEDKHMQQQQQFQVLQQQYQTYQMQPQQQQSYQNEQQQKQPQLKHNANTQQPANENTAYMGGQSASSASATSGMPTRYPTMSASFKVPPPPIPPQLPLLPAATAQTLSNSHLPKQNSDTGSINSASYTSAVGYTSQYAAANWYSGSINTVTTTATQLLNKCTDTVAATTTNTSTDNQWYFLPISYQMPTTATGSIYGAASSAAAPMPPFPSTPAPPLPSTPAMPLPPIPTGPYPSTHAATTQSRKSKPSESSSSNVQNSAVDSTVSTQRPDTWKSTRRKRTVNGTIFKLIRHPGRNKDGKRTAPTLRLAAAAAVKRYQKNGKLPTNIPLLDILIRHNIKGSEVLSARKDSTIVVGSSGSYFDYAAIARSEQPLIEKMGIAIYECITPQVRGECRLKTL